MKNNNAIEVKNVYKKFKLCSDKPATLKERIVFWKKNKIDYHEVLKNINLNIEKGETVALIGVNGSGKSTLLKLMTKIIYPTKGQIITHGKLTSLLELGAGFHPDFTGRENIYLKGHILGLKDSEISALEEEIIEFSELEEYIDQPVRTYSSGMKSRLGFAINVNIRPEILIVDEALSVGDADFKNKCKEKVNEIINNENVTLLFVTHQKSVAQEFCKRGIVLKKGKLKFDGEINEAIEKYVAIYKKKKSKSVVSESVVSESLNKGE